MARLRRTRFAASVVVIVGAGCGGARPAQEWKVTPRDGGGCYAEPVVCARCNPPAPTPIACPAGVATDGTARIASYDTRSCVIEGTPTPIACPSAAPPPPDAGPAASDTIDAWPHARAAPGSPPPSSP